MSEENNPGAASAAEAGAEKPWNEQLKDWVNNYCVSQKMTITAVGRQLGISESTFKDYLSGRVTRFDRVSPLNKRKLYEATKLKCFECEDPVNSSRIEIGEPERKAAPESSSEGKNLGDSVNAVNAAFHNTIDSIVENISEKLALDAHERFKEGLLKAQRYSPSAAERASAIVELIEVLGFEADYFRTAPERERLVLTEKLKENADSLGYATQMLNILYSGKAMDSWMLMAQPPAKLKRVLKESDKKGAK